MEMISPDDFKKLDLRVARILSAGRIEGSDKLLCLKVDLGAEQRQLVAGIGRVYTPEELVGKEIIIVANLEPKMIKGVESQGMLLAVDSKDGPVVLGPDREVMVGAAVK